MRDRYAGFDRFVATRGAALMRTASLLTAYRTAAEDALQEALTRAALKWPELSTTGAPEEYVRDELYRCALDERRPEGALDTTSSQQPGPAALGFDVAFARLSHRQRLVLVLRFYEGLSDASTADVLGCSARTVQFETGQALARLRMLAPDLATAFRDEVPTDFAGGGSTEVLT